MAGRSAARLEFVSVFMQYLLVLPNKIICSNIVQLYVPQQVQPWRKDVKMAQETLNNLAENLTDQQYRDFVSKEPALGQEVRAGKDKGSCDRNSSL